MSPDSLSPSRTRRAWRFISAFACVLAATSLLVSVVLFTRINDERKRNLRNNCTETNARHDATIRKLDELTAARLETASPAEVKRIAQSRDSTVLLIDALVPVKDCDRLVSQQVQSSRP